ncbi:MAG: flavodoxin [Clostridiales Family XIII bacterium]|jgi:flavodoxin short chain|nr:flavodoxin [Clostridiales Family XIII bacterium]
MGNAAVIYWSGTGNTEKMANAVLEGLKGAGAEADLFEVGAISAADAAAYGRLALGCPSMGDEVLEEDSFEPFYTELEGSISGKPIALFGSYGWGDGAWMRDWSERCKGKGANLVADGLIANEEPDDGALAECKALGEALAKA